MIDAGSTLTVRVPLNIRRRGGRKLVVAPEGGVVAVQARVDNALVKALARAFRWRRMWWIQAVVATPGRRVVRWRVGGVRIGLRGRNVRHLVVRE